MVGEGRCWAQAAAAAGVASPGSTSRTLAPGLLPLVSIHSTDLWLPTWLAEAA